MSSQKIKIKNLIENVAITPMPTHFIVDLLRSELSFLKVFNSWDRKLGLPDKELFDEDRGYNGIELTLWGFFDRYWNINQKRLKIIKKSNIPIYTFHGCFESCPRSFRGYYLNLALKDSYIVKALKSHIDIACELGRNNPIITFHPGFPAISDSKERALNNVINNLESILEYAALKNVTLTLENMDYQPGSRILLSDHYDFEYVFSKIKHQNLKITFDWGHLNSQAKNKDFRMRHELGKEDIFKFKHINEFIEKMNNNIVHAHVHYNRSHESFKIIPGKEGRLKKFFLYLFFWTNISKFIRRGVIGLDMFDEHLPFNRVEKKYLLNFGATIRNLIYKTSIKNYGYITHEISPMKILKYFTYSKDGAANLDDFYKSLNIFKNFYQYCDGYDINSQFCLDRNSNIL